MNKRDPKLTALQFNEYIYNQNIKGLTSLMPEDFTFIDIPGKVEKGKELMTKNWMSFFEEFPDYRNIFTRVKSQDIYVILIGYSTNYQIININHRSFRLVHRLLLMKEYWNISKTCKIIEFFILRQKLIY